MIELEDIFFKYHRGATINSVKCVQLENDPIERVFIANNSGLQWVDNINGEICVSQIPFGHIPQEYVISGFYWIEVSKKNFLYITASPTHQSSQYHILGLTISRDENNQWHIDMFQDFLVDYNPLDIKCTLIGDVYYAIVLSYDRYQVHCYEISPGTGVLHRRNTRQNVLIDLRSYLGVKSTDGDSRQPISVLVENTSEGTQYITTYCNGFLNWNRVLVEKLEKSHSHDTCHNLSNRSSSRSKLNVFENDNNTTANTYTSSHHHKKFNTLEQINEINMNDVFERLFHDDVSSLQLSISDGNTFGHPQLEDCQYSILLDGVITCICANKSKGRKNRLTDSIIMGLSTGMTIIMSLCETGLNPILLYPSTNMLFTETSHHQYPSLDSSDCVENSNSNSVQCIAIGTITFKGINDIIVGYENGYVCIFSLSPDISGYVYSEIWRRRFPYPVVHVSYGTLLPNDTSSVSENSKTNTIHAQYNFDQLLVVTTKTYHVFSLR